MKASVAGFLVAASVSIGCASPPHHTAGESAAATVSTGRVEVTTLSSPFEAGGIVRARATAMIASRVMAPIVAVHVHAGERVRRGATLITLDARDIQANKDRAEAAVLSAAEAARAADADVRGAESTLILARLNHDRMAGLVSKRSATAQELDQAVAARAAAEAQHTSALARLAAANAARDAAQASAESARVNATYTSITAPFDGLVTERRADPGSLATPGATLLTLEDPAAYRLEVQIDEARASLVETGHAAAVRLDNPAGEGNGWINARVTEIDRVDPGSHAFLVKIDLPASASLRSGLFGRARFSGPARQGLAVPTSALIKRGQLTFVYLVDAEERARLRPVSVGGSERDRTEVLAGLRDGDVIVTNPPASLTDGARVARGPR